MRSGALENGEAVAGSPYHQPIPRVGNMTFVATRPGAFQRVHVMPLSQNSHRLVGILRNKIDNFRKHRYIVVLLYQGLNIPTSRSKREV